MGWCMAWCMAWCMGGGVVCMAGGVVGLVRLDLEVGGLVLDEVKL